MPATPSSLRNSKLNNLEYRKQRGGEDNLLFCWVFDERVMKWACSLSAIAFPSVINWWHKSELKQADAPPVSVTANNCIGKLGMFAENALK